MVKQYKGYKGEAQQYLVLFSLGLQPVLLLGGQPVVVVLAVALPLISGSGRTSTGHLGLGLVAAEALQHFRLGSVVVVGFFGVLGAVEVLEFRNGESRGTGFRFLQRDNDRGRSSGKIEETLVVLRSAAVGISG